MSDQAGPSSVGTSQTHPYTCLSCSLAFTNATLQRDHYITDLHRYNSKRRVAGLTPVTLELFEEKILDRTEVQPEDSGRLSCKPCKYVILVVFWCHHLPRSYN